MTGRQETVNLDTLDPQQLTQVKKQLDEELEHLTSSYGQLHGAQNKFRECLRCVQTRAATPKDSSSVLVPLTNSLYVRGEISDSDRVLVDVGTGFLVDKVGQDTHSQTPTSKVSPIIACLQKLKSAEQFYNAKVEELSTNLKDLENVIQRKQTNARTVEEVLRQKIMASQSSQAAQS